MEKAYSTKEKQNSLHREDPGLLIAAYKMTPRLCGLKDGSPIRHLANRFRPSCCWPRLVDSHFVKLLPTGKCW